MLEQWHAARSIPLSKCAAIPTGSPLIFAVTLVAYIGAHEVGSDFLWMLIKWLDLSASRARTTINASETSVVDNFGTERSADSSNGQNQFVGCGRFSAKFI